MKRKSFKLLLLLPLIVFLVSGCKKRISNDTLKSEVMTEEICLLACDKMEDKAMAEYEQCKKEALDLLLAQKCTTLVCVNNALESYVKMLAECDEGYKKKLDEVKKCRKDCRIKFLQMMSIDPN